MPQAAQYDGVAIAIQELEAAMPSLTDVLTLLTIVQSLLQLGQALRLVVVTRGVQRPVGRAATVASAASLFAGGVWGFARVLQLETPALTVTAADQPRGPTAEAAANALFSEASGPGSKERLLAWSTRAPHAVRLRRGAAVSDAQRASEDTCSSASYAITGASSGHLSPHRSHVAVTHACTLLTPYVSRVEVPCGASADRWAWGARAACSDNARKVGSVACGAHVAQRPHCPGRPGPRGADGAAKCVRNAGRVAAMRRWPQRGGGGDDARLTCLCALRAEHLACCWPW